MLLVANSTPMVDFDSRLNSLRVKRDSTGMQDELDSTKMNWLAHDFCNHSDRTQERQIHQLVVSQPRLWSHARFPYSGISNQHNLRVYSTSTASSTKPAAGVTTNLEQIVIVRSLCHLQNRLSSCIVDPRKGKCVFQQIAEEAASPPLSVAQATLDDSSDGRVKIETARIDR